MNDAELQAAEASLAKMNARNTEIQNLCAELQKKQRRIAIGMQQDALVRSELLEERANLKAEYDVLHEAVGIQVLLRKREAEAKAKETTNAEG